MKEKTFLEVLFWKNFKELLKAELSEQVNMIMSGEQVVRKEPVKAGRC